METVKAVVEEIRKVPSPEPIENIVDEELENPQKPETSEKKKEESPARIESDGDTVTKTKNVNEPEPMETTESDSKAERPTSLQEFLSTDIEKLFEKYSGDHDSFKETLKYHLEVTEKEKLRYEKLWNEQLRISMKIEECLHRIDRKEFIKQGKFMNCEEEKSKTAAESSSKNKTTASRNAVSEENSNDKMDFESTNNEEEQTRKNNSLKINQSIQNLVNFNEEYEKIMKQTNEFTERYAMNRLKALSNSESDILSKSLPLLTSSNNGTNNGNSSYLVQGRQGPIIDVQSIIADFRQKNPQDIPRRGRRLKNVGELQQQLSSFNGGNNNYSTNNKNQNNFNDNGNNSSSGLPSNAELQEFLAKAQGGSMNFHPALSAVSNNNQDSLRNQKLPEISLYPVHNFYNSTPTTSAAASLPGSLLHGILTKVSL